MHSTGARLLSSAIVVTVLAMVGIAGVAEPAVAARPLPGTLLSAQPVLAPGVHATAYAVRYASRSVPRTKYVEVTGLVFVPNSPPPPGGYPIVSWAHFTNGMADACAPSLQPAAAVFGINLLLDQGFEVTATDYQGEGTKGLLPYLVGESAARNTVDIVRAARELPAANASARYAVWGYSEGGQTALFALHIAASYAPELQLAGVVAGGAPARLPQVLAHLGSFPGQGMGFLVMVAGGYKAAYGNRLAPTKQLLTRSGRKLVKLLDQQCGVLSAAGRLTGPGWSRYGRVACVDGGEQHRQLHKRGSGAAAARPWWQRRTRPAVDDCGRHDAALRPWPASAAVGVSRPAPFRNDPDVRP